MGKAAKSAPADILEAIDRARELVRHKSFDGFAADWRVRYAAERCLEILSEASRRLPEDLRREQPEIDWRAVADIGNFLRHEYHHTSAKIVWDVIRSRLDPLEAAVRAIGLRLAEAEDDSDG